MKFSNTMIQRIAVLLLLAIPVSLHAQGTKVKPDLVPEPVLKAYAEKYKKRPVKAWYEDERGFSAVFEKGDLRPRAYFSNSGEWLRTATEIKESAVGSAVKKAVANTSWSDWKMAECYKVETPEHVKLFELHLKQGKERKVLLFDPAGKALSIE
jgi:hypothetical protein